MADDKRSRLKRESSQSRKEVKVTTSKERKPTQTRENTKPTASTSKSTLKKTTVPQKSTQKSTVERTSKKPSTEDVKKKSEDIKRKSVEVKRKPVVKEPVISGSQRKVVLKSDVKKKEEIQKSLARKVNIVDTKSKIVTGTSRVRNEVLKPKVTYKNEAIEKKKISKDGTPSSRTEGRSMSRLSRDRTRTRTLSPGESKLLKMQTSHVKSINDEKPTEPESEAEEVEDYYESDFESDFESESSESEKSISSSSSEEESNKEAPREMSSVVTPTSRPLSAVRQQQVTSSPVTPSPQQAKVEPPIRKIEQEKMKVERPRPEKSEMTRFKERNKIEFEKVETSFRQSSAINFTAARQRQAKLQAMERATSRGSELLSMIKLDTVNFTLLYLPPSKYEVLMNVYGNLNATQVQTQTGDGNFEKEIQTEEVTKCDHWTQHPPCLIQDNTSLQGLQAVGPQENTQITPWPNLDYAKLEKFLSKAAEMVLAVMNETSSMTSEGSLNSLELGLGLEEFAESGVTLGSMFGLLSDRNVTLMKFGDHSRILTVHSASTSDKDHQLQQDLICIWSITQPEYPRHVLGSRGIVTSLCLHQSWPFLVIAGINNGAICIWDLQEPNHYHPSVTVDKIKTYIRTPTFTTALVSDAHKHSIINIAPLPGGQVVSVDEIGLIITWSVLRLISSDLGAQTSWGKYQMMLSNKNILSDVEELEVCDMSVIGDRILVALDCGVVKSINNLKPGTKAAKSFSSKHGSSTKGQCKIINCPYESQHFLVLESSGCACLYNLKNTSALWTSPLYEMGISKPVQLSWGKSGLIFLLQSNIHIQIWDLTKNQTKPILTSRLDKEVASLISSQLSNHIAVSTSDGNYILFL